MTETADSDADAPGAREEVLAYIEANVSEDDPHTAINYLFERARKDHYHNSRASLKRAFEALKREGEVVNWIGLVTLPRDDLLRAWIEEEVHDREITRSLLVGKLNKIKAGEYDFTMEGDVADD